MAMAEPIASQQQASVPASVISNQAAVLKNEAVSDMRALAKQFQEGNYGEMKKTAGNISVLAAKLEVLGTIAKSGSSQSSGGQKSGSSNGGFLSSLRIEKKA